MTMDDRPENPPSAFERLPLEIRQKIYGLLGYPVLINDAALVDRSYVERIPVRAQHRFADSTGKHAHRTIANYTSMQARQSSVETIYLALLRVNKAISADLYSLLYSQTMFTFMFDISSDDLFLSSRGLGYLTHVTVGPFMHGRGSWDPERVMALGDSVDFICHNCPRIEVLGVNVISADLVKAPWDGFMPLVNSVSHAAGHCSSLKRIIFGMGKLPYETIELATLPVTEREDEISDWVITLLAQIENMVEGIAVGRRLSIYRIT